MNHCKNIYFGEDKQIINDNMLNSVTSLDNLLFIDIVIGPFCAEVLLCRLACAVGFWFGGFAFVGRYGKENINIC